MLAGAETMRVSLSDELLHPVTKLFNSMKNAKDHIME
jgi:hypothetical protein